jgi:hypothetical protein
MATDWAVYALSTTGVLFLAWFWQLYREGPPIWAILVSFAHLFVAASSSAAPLRGLIDPRA